MKLRGCHGDPSVFSFGSQVCAGCNAFASCRTATRTMLETIDAPAAVYLLREHDKFEAIARGSKDTTSATIGMMGGKKTLSDDEEAVALSLPVKVQSQYRRLVLEGYPAIMRGALANRTNPFKREGYLYLHVAFAALIEGGFTKKELRERYMTELGWKEGTAFSAVSIVWHLFQAVGVGKQMIDTLVPKN